MQHHSQKYIFVFALLICAICSTVISVAAVSLNDRQQRNRELDKKRSVLLAARIVQDGQSVSADEIEQAFGEIESVVLNLESGETLTGEAAAEFTPESSGTMDPGSNTAGITEVPTQVQVFLVKENGKLDMVVLPIYGKGLWGTLYGYLAVGADGETIEGITYYNHKETPGLGGEVDNPKWKNRWPGRQIYGPQGDVKIAVKKGAAGPVDEDPYHVDGLSGATITSRGVTNMLQFWLSDDYFGSYLDKLSTQEA